jgi:hypothetical protein
MTGAGLAQRQTTTAFGGGCQLLERDVQAVVLIFFESGHSRAFVESAFVGDGR